MDNVEFEEEKYLHKNPGYVFKFKKKSRFSKFLPNFRNTEERNTTIILILFSFVLFGAAGVIYFKQHTGENAIKVIDPNSISQLEKFKLPENIRIYIK